MPKFLVRADVTFSTVVEAKSQEEAVNNAPELPSSQDWDKSDPDWSAEEA